MCDKLTPKEERPVPSAGMVMATLFWDLHRLPIDCLQNEGTGHQYASVLSELASEIKEKCTVPSGRNTTAQVSNRDGET